MAVFPNMRSPTLSFKRLILRFATLLGIAVLPVSARAVYFDLRNLTPTQSFSHTLTVGGITMHLGSLSSGKLTSGASTFGLDAGSASDDPALIDGGGGSADEISIQTSQKVLIESFLISRFDAIDHGSFDLKGGQSFALVNGVNPINIVISGSSAHALRWTGDTNTGGGRGFSLDGFTVRLLDSFTYQAGDYNNNKRADGADYVAWRNAIGTSYAQSGYQAWRSHFGESIPGSGAAAGSEIVPEPASALALLTAVLAAFGRARPAVKFGERANLKRSRILL